VSCGAHKIRASDESELEAVRCSLALTCPSLPGW
jgi:hypothetical protein